DEIRLIQSARFLAMCFCVLDVGQSACAQIVGSLQPLGGVVVEAVRILMSEEQGDRRGEDAQLLEVGIGDGIDGLGGSAGSHEGSLSAWRGDGLPVPPTIE